MLTSAQSGVLLAMLREREAVLRAKVRKTENGSPIFDTRDLLAGDRGMSEQYGDEPLDDTDLCEPDADSEKLLAIEAALEAMEDNFYGYCLVCKEPIGFERCWRYPRRNVVCPVRNTTNASAGGLDRQTCETPAMICQRPWR